MEEEAERSDIENNYLKIEACKISLHLREGN